MANDGRIQRDDAIPLYHQIFLALRDAIHAGELAFGAMVPTEHELIDRFGVSRITARRALQELADAGLVERRRRIGTRVVYRARKPAIEASPEQAVESLIAFGRDTAVRVLEYGAEPATPDVAASLAVEPGTPVLRALRLRLLDGAPLGVIESHVPATLKAVLTRAKLRTTPLLELLRSAGYAVGEGHQLISAVGAGPALASQLEVEPRAPIIRIERITFAVDGTPLARTVAHYRGDRYRLSLDMRAVPHPITS